MAEERAAWLPPELVHEIMGVVYAHQDEESRATLGACCLTCRQWHACSRPLYFRDITIDTELQLQHFISLLEDNEHIGSFVIYLTIIDKFHEARSPYRYKNPGSYERSVPDHWNQKSPFPEKLDAALHDEFPKKLKTLQSLTLVGYSGNGESFSSQTLQSLSQFSTLTKLVLDNCYIAPVVLRTFACGFRNLQELQIVDIAQKADHPDIPNLHSELDSLEASYPSLRSFSYYAGPMNRDDPSFDWLLRSPSRHTIRSLSVMIEIDAPEPFDRLLREVGPHLEHLSFEIEGSPLCHWVGTDAYKRELDLSTAKNIKTLTIRANVNPSVLLPHFLSQISTPHLSLLVIIMTNIRYYRKTELENTLPTYLSQLSYLQPDKGSRLIFANDPIKPTELRPMLDSDDEGDDDDDTKGETVQKLESYLNCIFGEVKSLVPFEVMDLQSASRLCVARPIDL